MALHVILRLDAPLMSFGGVKVDERGPTELFPGKSLIAGLLGNALGYDHGDAVLLQRLQERLVYGARRDRGGRVVTDYQTADLGQDHLAHEGWTMRDRPEGREGGAASQGTAIRLRQYLADALYTVVLRLEPDTEPPTLDDLERALQRPARPLFLGRKPCIPSRPILAGRLEAGTLLEALVRAPVPAERECDAVPLTAWLPAEEVSGGPARELLVADERDWRNQIVVGGRLVKQVTLVPSREAP